MFSPELRGRYRGVIWGAVACIAAIDAVPALAPATDNFVNKLDDLAHLATSIIVVVLLAPGRVFSAALVVSSLAIDLDHVPGFAGWSVPNDASARPYHSVAVIAILLAVSALAPRARVFAAGCAAGVAVHLWRDLCTGPGVPLLWPLSAAVVRLPYAVYGISVLAAVAVIALRPRLRSQSASH